MYYFLDHNPFIRNKNQYGENFYGRQTGFDNSWMER